MLQFFLPLIFKVHWCRAAKSRMAFQGLLNFSGATGHYIDLQTEVISFLIGFQNLLFGNSGNIGFSPGNNSVATYRFLIIFF